jgi:hypothetical protein
MASTTRAELLAALSDNDLQIKQAVAITVDTVRDEWQREFDRILELRTA